MLQKQIDHRLTLLLARIAKAFAHCELAEPHRITSQPVFISNFGQTDFTHAIQTLTTSRPIDLILQNQDLIDHTCDVTSRLHVAASPDGHHVVTASAAAAST